MHKKESKSRRNFIKKSGMIGTGVFIVPRHVLGGKDFTAPSDQLGLAAIGSGGKGTSDISNAYQNGKNRVVALCDVDPARAKSAYTTHADVNKYIDYREMLEKEKDIDALTISTLITITQNCLRLYEQRHSRLCTKTSNSYHC